jgi:hypothetical protein
MTIDRGGDDGHAARGAHGGMPIELEGTVVDQPRRRTRRTGMSAVPGGS